MIKRISFILLALVTVIMMVASITEKFIGSAATAIYGSWWFAATWALLSVAGVCYCLKRQMQRRPALLLFHLSLVVILIGALITHIWGQSGTLHLRSGLEAKQFMLEDGHWDQLPFSLRLETFELQCYPGTETPMDFISTVSTSDGHNLTISMNNIGQHIHYRFYMSGYDPDLQGILLAVSHDPWGIGVTYTGYGLLFISMFLLLVLPSEGFRRALRRLSVIAVLLFGTILSGQSAQAATTPLRSEPTVLPAEQADAFCSLYTYWNGRICPVQTVARQFTTKLYGKPSYHGYSAEQVFTGWIFYPSTWLHEPMIKVKAEAAEVLGADGKFVSYSQYFDNGTYRLSDLLHQADRSLLEAHEKASLLEMLHSGQLLKLFPIDGRWYAATDDLPADLHQENLLFVKKATDYLGELAATHQSDRFIEAVGKLRRFQQTQAVDTQGESLLPSQQRFRAEQLYNVSDHTRIMAMAFATIGILLFIFLVARRLAALPRVVRFLARLLLGTASVYMLWLLGLRTYVSEHLPLSNGFETMQFMALVILLLTLMLSRGRLASLFLSIGFLLSGLTLMVSTFGQSNPQITPLMPVLQSPLLSIHVCIIMVSYSLLAFCTLCGIAALLLPEAPNVETGTRQTTSQDQLANLSRAMLFPALFCMAAGIFVGAIWANVSWGRYWGWDPKEVWALITMLVYAFALHGQSLPLLRRPRAYHLYMVLAFLTVLMTYFGVNFLLGGMHSYANS